jgi:hypothetical protein
MHTKILVGKTEGKISLGRSRHKWKEDVKINSKETGYENVDRICLAQDRDRWRAVLNTIMDLQVGQRAGNFLTS